MVEEVAAPAAPAVGSILVPWRDPVVRRSSARVAWTVGLAAALLLCGPAAPDDREGARGSFAWTGVPRVVAVGDVHGSYAEVRGLLLRLGLIDEQNAWAGGRDHLVFLGDLLDRGSRERELLDMIRRLQPEAAAAGGRVHVVLGNHETMNLVRDFRYVSPVGFVAFQEFAGPDDRAEAWGDYHRRMRGSALSKVEQKEAFEEDHPPGYFGRARAFGPGGEYAEWLLRQQAAVMINGVVFVHGGLTEAVAGMGLDGINRRVVSDILDFVKQRSILEDEGEVGPFDSFREVMSSAAAVQAYANSRKSERARQAAVRLRAFLDSIVVLPDGPLWYRGNSLEDERIERSRLDETLDLLDARAIVVGHSVTRSGRIQSRFGGTLYRVDVGLYKGRTPQALVFTGDEALVFDQGSGSLVAALAEPPQGEQGRPAYPELSDLHVERVLETGEVRSVRPLGRGGTRPLLLDLSDGQYEMRGLFKNVDRWIESRRVDGVVVRRADRFQHEVAAYRLDRLLGLGMVPVTVARFIQDEDAGPGSVQRWIEGAVEDLTAVPGPLPDAYLARVSVLQERARVFDALIGNADRQPEDYLHQLAEGWLYLVDHSSAFATDSGVGSFLGGQGCTLDSTMERALRSLSPREVRDQLTPWLNGEEIQAIFDRRDRLLRTCDRATATLQPM